jgi:hypothetical protein
MDLTNQDIVDASLLVVGPPVHVRDLLADLEFEPIVAEFTDEQPGYRFDLGNLVLTAAQLTNMYLRPHMRFHALLSTQRRLASIEFDLPMILESFEQGVALIADGVGRFTPARPVAWLDQGRAWVDHLPGRQRLRLFEKRPQCHVAAAWFRVAVKELTAAGERADEMDQFSIGFCDGAVSFKFPQGNVLPLPATGDTWNQLYFCKVKGLANLSRRTPSAGVSFSVWEGSFRLGGLLLPLESSSKRAPRDAPPMDSTPLA